MLMKGLARHFGHGKFKARDITRICNSEVQLDESEQLIRESLLDLYPSRQELSPVTAGRLLKGMRDQILDGERIASLGVDADGVSLFQLQSMPATCPGDLVPEAEPL